MMLSTVFGKGTQVYALGRMCPRCLRESWKSISFIRYFSNSASNKFYPQKSIHQIQVIHVSSRTSLLRRTSHPNFSFGLLPISLSAGLTRSYVTSAGIQKTVTGLVAKRPARKKVIPSKEAQDGKMMVTAYAMAEELNISQLRKALEAQGLYVIHELPVDVTGGLYAKAKYKVDKELREMFFFKIGSVVFWNTPEVERSEVLKFLRRHCEAPYDRSIVMHEMEDMPFIMTNEPTNLVGELIQIHEKEEEEGHQILEKYTFSNALSQAVNLGVWEASLEKLVDLVEPVTEDLRDGKKIRMSRREVLRRTGELFSLRHVINLSSDLLDTPDFYWDRGMLEPLYQKACNHLNISRRTRVMNERLSHLCELMELLSTHLNDTHHTRLEWMIIILILVEVVFEIVHYIERYLSADQQYQQDMAVQEGQQSS
ncbi:required for meiotic nuclear division protein 1 homolog [Haliotis rufescens]|uniref:required for meiotic nuclear division protein 1 homolog n=1 Tax=Haliotis rufescens TaxID=6454 RepID=UPI00201E8BB2|nr:required for meiotic nuclear division protein 1 homolog [Haliotis rufescens]